MMVTSFSALVCLFWLNVKISSNSSWAARSFGKLSRPVPREGNDIDDIPLSSAMFRHFKKIPLNIWKIKAQTLIKDDHNHSLLFLKFTIYRSLIQSRLLNKLPKIQILNYTALPSEVRFYLFAKRVRLRDRWTCSSA